MAGPLVAVVMLTGACSGEPPEVAAPVTTLSTTSTTVTSTVPSTTSTSPTTTTTTTTTTLVIPDGIPEEAFARVGAPYPEFDSTFPDGFDAEAWLRAYEEWNRWAYANPQVGVETLDRWAVSNSEMYETLLTDLGRLREEGWVSVGLTQLKIIDAQAQSEGSGRTIITLISQVSGMMWILDGDEIAAMEDFDGTPARESILELSNEGGEGSWKLVSWR